MYVSAFPERVRGRCAGSGLASRARRLTPAAMGMERTHACDSCAHGSFVQIKMEVKDFGWLQFMAVNGKRSRVLLDGEDASAEVLEQIFAKFPPLKGLLMQSN